MMLLPLAALFFLACPLLTVTEVSDTTKPLAGQTKLVIRNQNGGVQLSRTSDSSVALHVTKRVTGPNQAECQSRLSDIQVAVTDTGSSIGVFVDLPSGGTYSYGVDIEARLPASLETDIRSSNGDISASEFSSPVKLATTNGTIDVSNVSAQVDVATTNGRISLDGIVGSVKGTSSNGSIEVETALPDSGFCRLENSNGSVTLRIPESTSAQIFVTTTNGEIRHNNLVIAGNVGRQQIDGRLGEGGGDIYVTTTNADVVLSGY